MNEISNRPSGAPKPYSEPIRSQVNWGAVAKTGAITLLPWVPWLMPGTNRQKTLAGVMVLGTTFYLQAGGLKGIREQFLQPGGPDKTKASEVVSNIDGSCILPGGLGAKRAVAVLTVDLFRAFRAGQKEAQPQEGAGDGKIP